MLSSTVSIHSETSNMKRSVSYCFKRVETQVSLARFHSFWFSFSSCITRLWKRKIFCWLFPFYHFCWRRPTVCQVRNDLSLSYTALHVLGPQQKPKNNAPSSQPKADTKTKPSQPAAKETKGTPPAKSTNAARQSGTKQSTDATAQNKNGANQARAKKSPDASAQQGNGAKKDPAGDFKRTPTKGPNPPTDRKLEEALKKQGRADQPYFAGGGNAFKVGPDGKWQQTAKNGQQL